MVFMMNGYVGMLFVLVVVIVGVGVVVDSCVVCVNVVGGFVMVVSIKVVSKRLMFVVSVVCCLLICWCMWGGCDMLIVVIGLLVRLIWVGLLGLFWCYLVVMRLLSGLFGVVLWVCVLWLWWLLIDWWVDWLLLIWIVWFLCFLVFFFVLFVMIVWFF